MSDETRNNGKFDEAGTWLEGEREKERKDDGDDNSVSCCSFVHHQKTEERVK